MRFDSLLILALYWVTPSLVEAGVPSWTLLGRRTSQSSSHQSHISHIEHSQRPWRQLSDRIIQAIWPASSPNSSISKGSPTSKSFRQPTKSRFARYGGDVVLRFTVTTEDEVKALAEATSILFLDIWEFNDDWVDIRIAKDVVCVPVLEDVVLYSC